MLNKGGNHGMVQTFCPKKELHVSICFLKVNSKQRSINLYYGSQAKIDVIDTTKYWRMRSGLSKTEMEISVMHALGMIFMGSSGPSDWAVIPMP